MLCQKQKGGDQFCLRTRGTDRRPPPFFFHTITHLFAAAPRCVLGESLDRPTRWDALDFHHPANDRAALWDLTSTVRKSHYFLCRSWHSPHATKGLRREYSRSCLGCHPFYGLPRRQSSRMRRTARCMESSVSKLSDMKLSTFNREKKTSLSITVNKNWENRPSVPNFF